MRDRESMKKRHFTLVELLTVIIIVVVLAGIVVGGGRFARVKAAQAKTRAELQKLGIALEQYAREYGHYPLMPAGSSTADGFEITREWINDLVDRDDRLLINPSDLRFSGPNDSDKCLDARGTSYRYRYPGAKNVGSYDLWSYGQDKKSSTDDEGLDDITNWTRQ
jgi:general secretion pathway protein G